MSLKDKIISFVQWLCRIKLRIARGRTWFIEFLAIYSLSASTKILFPGYPNYFYLLLMPILVMLVYLIAHIEQFILKSWPYEVGYATKELNPVFKEMLEKIDNIEKAIVGIEKRLK